MGHIRLGDLPRTRKWQQVVALLEVGAGAAQLANATISAAEPPAVLSNLKMEVGGGGHGDVHKDVYGKVMETLPDGGRFQLRFTSVPKEAAAFFESVLAESRKA